MTIRSLMLLAALAAPAAAGPARDVRETACLKSCLVPHEKETAGCQVFKSPEESRSCASRSDKRRDRCERACHDRAEARMRKYERAKDEKDLRDEREDRRERFNRQDELGPREGTK